MAAVPSGGSALLANGQAQLSVTLEGPTRQSAASVPQPEVRRAPGGEVGLYTASYKMREAGEYKLRVKVDGYSLPGSPFRLSARPGETDATRTTAHGKGLDGRWQAGRLATFTIISRDRFGNKCLSGGCQWRVTYMSSGGDGNEREQHASVTDNSDGTYHVQVRLGGRDCGAHNETCFRHTTRTFKLTMRAVLSLFLSLPCLCTVHAHAGGRVRGEHHCRGRRTEGLAHRRLALYNQLLVQPHLGGALARPRGGA